MKELLPTIEAWGEAASTAGRAVVIRTFGSAPRPEGAVLLVTDDGRLAGSISGGCVEGAAVDEIERAQRTGHSRVIRYGISDEQAWDVGLACGGTIDVLVEPRVAEPALRAARDAARDGGHGTAVVTPLPIDSPPAELRDHVPGEGAPPDPKLTVDAAGLRGSLGDAALDGALIEAAHEALRRGSSKTIELGGRSLFVEVFPVRPRLVIVGATEAARALASMAHTLGYEAIVIDARATFAAKDRFPDVERLINDWPEDAFDTVNVGPEDAVAVLSHDPKFDEPAIADAFRRGARYVGAVGSRKTQADRRARLREMSVTDADLARLHGPIGLDLGGRAPAETALAIMSEIVAERYGGSGRPMVDKARPAEPATSAR
jgi:xanthine dehydrogenase accessory factor